jgi:hypothetical protein
VKKLGFLVLTLLLMAPISRQLSNQPGPVPICPPDDPTGCAISSSPLALP